MRVVLLDEIELECPAIQVIDDTDFDPEVHMDVWEYRALEAAAYEAQKVV